MQNIGQRIKKIRESKGIKQVWIARQTGLNRTYLYQLESDIIKNPSMEALTKIAKALGVSLNELIGEESSISQFPLQTLPLRQIPVYGRIPAGYPKEMWHNYIEEYISVPDVPEDASGLRVSGDSMIGEGIDEGDIVIVVPNRQIYNGDIVVAIIDGSEFTLKKYFTDSEHVILAPANSHYKPIVFSYESFGERVRIIGVVIGLYKRIRGGRR